MALIPDPPAPLPGASARQAPLPGAPARRMLAVLGASGHGKMVIEAARAAGRWDAIVACDDAAARIGTQLLDLTVREGMGWLETQAPDAIDVIVAIGVNRVRAMLLDRLAARGFTAATVIHPAAIVSPSATIGAGVFVVPGAVIGADARLGRGAIVNTGASVDHDGVIGDCAHIGPGARLCGGVEVGARTLIGVGSALAPLVCVGADCTIGAGAAVVGRIDDGATAVGVPARIIRR